MSDSDDVLDLQFPISSRTGAYNVDIRLSVDGRIIDLWIEADAA
jgi:hypothetical protein